METDYGMNNPIRTAVNFIFILSPVYEAQHMMKMALRCFPGECEKNPKGAHVFLHVAASICEGKEALIGVN